jgi:hypothetical protein
MATINRKGIYESNKRPEKLSGGPDTENKYEDKYKAERERMVYRDLDISNKHKGILKNIAKVAAIWER